VLARSNPIRVEEPDPGTATQVDARVRPAPLDFIGGRPTRRVEKEAAVDFDQDGAGTGDVRVPTGGIEMPGVGKPEPLQPVGLVEMKNSPVPICVLLVNRFADYQRLADDAELPTANPWNVCEGPAWPGTAGRRWSRRLGIRRLCDTQGQCAKNS
jgi:hypothetical protein